MPKLNKVRATTLNQRGLAHIALVVVLLLGIASGVYLVQKQGYQLFKPKAYSTAPIPSDIDETTPEERELNWADWISQMHALGVYPAVEEGGEIVLYDRKQFIEKHCGEKTIPGTDIVSKGCYLNPPSFDEVLVGTSADIDLIKDLGVRLRDEGYAPLTVLKPFFPELNTINTDLTNALQALEPFCREEPEGLVCREGDDQYKRVITSGELEKFITEVATERGLSEKDPLKRLISISDPFFGTKAIINWATLPPSQVSDEERVNALLGLTLVYGLSEKVLVKGFHFARNAFVPLTEVISDVKVIRQSLQAGEAYQLSALVSDQRIAGNWVRNLSGPSSGRGFNVLGRQPNWVNKERLFPDPPQFRPGEALFREGLMPEPIFANSRFINDVQPYVKHGLVYVVSRGDVLVPVRTNIVRAIGNFQNTIGRDMRIDLTKLDRLVQQGTVYVLDDQAFKVPGAAGYAWEDMVVIKGSDYFTDFGVHIAHHEQIHIVSFSNGWTKGWTYAGANEEDKVLSAILELGTDFWTDLAVGQPVGSSQGLSLGGTYRSKYSQLYNLLTRYMYNNRQFYENILEFTLKPDKEILYRNINGGYAAFARALRNNGIEPRALGIIPAAGEFIRENEDGDQITVDPIIDIQDGFDQPDLTEDSE